MPSEKTLSRRKNLAASRAALKLERLESRLTLAGNVTAQLLGSTLKLTGDALGNELVVASAENGKIAVLGNGTTINGVATPFVTTVPVRNIVANLNGGNDFIGFSNDATSLGSQLSNVSVPLAQLFNPAALQAAIATVAPGITSFSVPGSLNVATGDGDDAVGIIGNVGGSVVANLGSAIGSEIPLGLGNYTGNFFGIGVSSAAAAAVQNRVGGSVSVKGGDQNDRVYLSDTAVGGAVSMALGKGGFNECGVGRVTVGSLTYSDAKAAATYIYLGRDITVQKDMRVSTHGLSTLRLGQGLVVGGNVIGKFGDQGNNVHLEGDLRGAVSISTGNGIDEIEVFDSSRGTTRVGQDFSIRSRGGNDKIFVRNMHVMRNTVIDAGDGNDQVDIGRAYGTAGSGFRTDKNLSVKLGAGNDVLELEYATALAAHLYGGTGVNTLSTNAETRAGVSKLQYYQFQTVNDV